MAFPLQNNRILVPLLSIAITCQVCISRATAQKQKLIERISSLPFREDSIRTFYSNGSLLPSIKHSKEPIEIRYYLFGTSQYQNDRILNIHINPLEITYGYREIEHHLPGARRIFLNHEKINAAINIDSAVTILFANLITQISDEKKVIDSLQGNGVKVSNSCIHKTDCLEQFRLIEIKVNNKFRNFQISSEFYADYNSAIQLFSLWDRLSETLSFIFNKSNLFVQSN